MSTIPKTRGGVKKSAKTRQATKRVKKANNRVKQTTKAPKNKPASKAKKKRAKEPQPNLRKQLFNDGAVGPMEHIQVSTERIVQLNGILFDIDPPLFREGPLTPELSRNPREFFKHTLQRWLDRDSVLNQAEVRMTGTGLHVIIWFEEPVVFEQDGERERWAAIVQVVQAALPIDPDQPGITATTRATGSTNSKNGEKVTRLKRGTPVAIDEVLGLFEKMRSEPFKTVLGILAGTDHLSPCPVCKKDNSQLRALNHVGTCYGSCGKVKLEQLYDIVLAPRTGNGKEDDDGGQG